MVWKLAPQKIDKISSSDELIEQLLVNRGLKTKRQWDEFFNPDLEDYQKDFEISGIALAKKRILAAVKNHELIIISGDSDLDGLCASVVL